ncbi:hypothetical protein V1517DRAFT_329815 [Lipomyces orientalis]|uniref:Uncharacterized protein n=1 Tax=Lipomyces orientalis TaxID=1233043 RepID=A0ACC3TGJ8_9ASCO
MCYVSGMSFRVLCFMTIVSALAVQVTCQSHTIPENYTLESFEIQPIQYDFDCDEGIFGMTVFTRLTGSIYMEVADPPRADGLSHEQAYFRMIRLLEDGDVIGAAQVYQNDESARFLRVANGLSNETMLSNCTQAILDHYLSVRRTRSLPNYLSTLQQASADGSYSGGDRSLWKRYSPSCHTNHGAYRCDWDYLDNTIARTSYNRALNYGLGGSVYKGRSRAGYARKGNLNQNRAVDTILDAIN